MSQHELGGESKPRGGIVVPFLAWTLFGGLFLAANLLVVPKVGGGFHDTKIPLPELTQLIVQIATFCTQYAWAVLAVWGLFAGLLLAGTFRFLERPLTVLMILAFGVTATAYTLGLVMPLASLVGGLGPKS